LLTLEALIRSVIDCCHSNSVVTKMGIGTVNSDPENKKKRKSLDDFWISL